MATARTKSDLTVLGPRRSRASSGLRSPLAYLFVFPALAIFTVFTIGPTIFTFVVSTFKWNWLNASQNKFIGLQNYQAMLEGSADPPFLQTLGVSAYFVLAMVVGGTAISLALALLLQSAAGSWSRSWSNKVLLGARTAIFLAHVTPLVATSIVWVWIFNPRYGLANLVLSWFSLPGIDWLGNSSYTMPAVIIYSLWHEIGFVTVIFLGGLTTLSPELSEAAKLDGCNRWQEFWNITFPQLRPFIIFVVVITSVASLQAFTQFFVMTKGGPDVATLGFQLYQQAFVFRKTGYAAALAVVLFALTVLLSILQLRSSRSVDSRSLRRSMHRSSHRGTPARSTTI
ncbi:carbohydrate ABC transporter permease [Psychromicrobium xiongbiense]|uniref:carbohydrate ABC transporter permease n=1 Tax=Psychromicrobium xiongbiense TaxID=3051184 RepID=UPI0025542A21|nr:sugar ABC transporter permease [Psychromicrobium sp. YIM S02556]